MTLHIAGTFYVPEDERRRVHLPALREGNNEGRALLFHNRGEVYIPAVVEEADSDDLLLLNQYQADAVVEAVRAAVKYGEVDPCRGTWVLDRRSGQLEVDRIPPEVDSTDPSEAM